MSDFRSEITKFNMRHPVKSAPFFVLSLYAYDISFKSLKYYNMKNTIYGQFLVWKHKFYQTFANKNHFSKAYFPLEIVFHIFHVSIQV